MLIVSVVVARFLSWLNTTFLGSAVCSLLKMYCDEVKHCLLLLPGFKSICMDSQFKGNIASFSPPPPEKWHVITSDCCFVLVDLTWSTFCVHIFRRQLQTNMAVRLCDVASLLRSGSWAPEPWTGVCGTTFFWHNLARRPAFCLSAQAIPMMLALSYFDAQIKFITCAIWNSGTFWVLFMKSSQFVKCLTVLVWSKPVCYCVLWCLSQNYLIKFNFMASVHKFVKMWFHNMHSGAIALICTWWIC